jgi:glycine/D-amino acid oxidase-like deaminating enzyme
VISSQTKFDLAVVGAGILGLSCALAAVRRNLKVVVIERSTHARGASVRNFGLITVTGQDPGTVWPLARRTRDVVSRLAAAKPAGGRIGCGDGQRSIEAAVPVPIKAVQCGAGSVGW